MRPADLENAYHQFYEATVRNEILSVKNTVMVQMAAAMALRCYP